MKRKSLFRSLLATTCAFASSAAFAQEAPPAEETASEYGDIVVTAQKRAQSLRDVPISIQVVTGESLRERDLNDLPNLTESLPAVKITDNGVATYLYIRGVGSGENSGFEQSVGTFIDGIYVGRGRTSRQQQLDLERIEVLRGPQSIFFGNSAIAGAFNVTTASPGSSWEGYVNASYEFELEGRELEAAAGGPLSDTIGIRIAGRYAKSDGWVTNIVDDSTAPATESWAFRATLAFDPTDTLSIVYKGGYAKNKSNGTPYEAIKCPPVTGIAPGAACLLAASDPAGNTIPLDYRKVSGNLPLPPGVFPNNVPIPQFADEFFRQESQLHSLNIDLDLGAGTLSSTTGFLKSDEPNIYDPDQTRYSIINVDSGEEFEQFSQELRFASNSDGALEYMFGGYYHHTKLELLTNSRFNVAFPSQIGPFPAGTPVQTQVVSLTDQREDLFSVFGQFKYKLTDAFAISVGGRYTTVKKRVVRLIDIQNIFGTGPASPAAAAFITATQGNVNGTYTGRLKNDKFTPEIVLEYDATDDVRIYAKYNKGFKAGGFDGGFKGSTAGSVNPPGLRFDPENVDAYEAGIKAALFDNRVSLNLSAFRSEYSDLQVAIFDAVSTQVLVKNVGKSVSQGIEFEGTFRATPEFRITAAATLLDAEYKSFTSAPCTAEQTAGIVPGCVARQQDLSGRDLQFAPKFSGTIAFNYETPIFDNFLLSGNLETNYSDAYFSTLDNDPDFRVPSGVHMNVRVAFGSIDRDWNLALLVRNLTKKDDFTAGINWPLANGSKLVTRERPRTIALAASYNF